MISKLVLFGKLLVAVALTSGVCRVVAAEPAVQAGVIQSIVLAGHTGPVRSAAFSPDDSKIVTTSDDRTARVWQASTGAQLYELTGHAESVKSAVFSSDGSEIVTVSGYMVHVWDAGTGKTKRTIPAHMGSAHSDRVFHYRGEYFITSDDAITRAWDRDMNALVYEFDGSIFGPALAAFSNEGSKGVLVREGIARVLNVRNGDLLCTLQGPARATGSAVFSHDGSKIVTTHYSDIACVWDAQTGAQLHTLTGPVWSAVFSPDSSKIVTASSDDTARVWDVHTGACLHTLTGHAGPVWLALFNSDGSKIVTVSQDGTARVWFDTRDRARQRESAHALALAQHPRLGENSPADFLDVHLRQYISSFGLADSFGPVN